MPFRLNAADPDFASRFDNFLDAKREGSIDVEEAVRVILARVRSEGDDALIDLTRRFDSLELTPDTLRISPEEIAQATAGTDPETMSALRLAHERILRHHERQKPVDDLYTDSIGATLGGRWTPIRSVGLYVPGGAASYPSSVLMNAVPAKVAGVSRIAMVVPARAGELNPLVLAAAQLAGVEEIYRIGGAQAVAALAFGTRTIAPVSKIVGPGNAYVATAKRQVFGTVGIDMIAGPSEVLIIADQDNNPEWLAADLLAQAEHDAAAQSILITDSPPLAAAVEDALERQLRRLPRQETARASWEEFGAIILVDDLMQQAPELTNRIAPEHLEIATDQPEALFALINDAGAVFLGRHTPEAIGDYVGGSNHVLPTSRSARFSSGLSVLDFMKRTSILKLTPESLRALAPAAIELARVEGLDAHGRSVAVRLNL
ncbi:histidinol dehydrogenase [Aureimonas fodinaquatilis]|uniref:Histidinol dehydrogenase n=1 Tax=Aureimonas fodinaquatilis TaxID=2565783 RepID=A0A5B0DRG1_9HYPH|nr:histidinol dehydrogenase [Aureimonas fodinaquatilis]KAA0968963.1 histidinol dehydrogenase [Aureimonas fodinaquatilis]